MIISIPFKAWQEKAEQENTLWSRCVDGGKHRVVDQGPSLSAPYWFVCVNCPAAFPECIYGGWYARVDRNGDYITKYRRNNDI